MPYINNEVPTPLGPIKTPKNKKKKNGRTRHHKSIQKFVAKKEEEDCYLGVIKGNKSTLMPKKPRVVVIISAPHFWVCFVAPPKTKQNEGGASLRF